MVRMPGQSKALCCSVTSNEEPHLAFYGASPSRVGGMISLTAIDVDDLLLH